jgi:hypothetical protein
MSTSCPYSTSVPVSVNIPPVNAAAAAGITTKAAKWWSVLECKQCSLRTRRTQVLRSQGNEVTKWQSCLCKTTVVGNFRSQEVPPENKGENAKSLHPAGIALLLEVCFSHHSQLLNYVGWQVSERVQNTGGGGGVIPTGEKQNRRKVCPSETSRYFKLAPRWNWIFGLLGCYTA